MMKKIVALLMVIVICLSLVGCDLNISSIDMLMRPPKLSGENNLLQQTFEANIGSKNIIMKTPLSGEYRSSYLLYDLDGDAILEALVLYCEPSKDKFASISVLKFQDENWNFVSNIKGRSEEIYEIDFADINGDGIFEILISWSPMVSAEQINSTALGESNNKNLAIYSYNGNSTTLIKTEIYTKLLVDDFNNDNVDELCIINLSFSNYKKITQGRIISFDNKYSLKKDLRFDLTGLTDIYNIATDSYISNTEGHSRIYIDGSVSENGFITEVIDISHSDFNVTLPLYESNVSSNPLTLRDVRIYSQDIDNDGLIEIPTLELLIAGTKISNNSDEHSSLNLTVWSQIIDNDLQMEFKCLFNGSYGYMFMFPDEWSNKITAVYNESTSTVTFYEIDNNLTLLNAIFSLRTSLKSDFENNNQGFTKFDESNAYVYGVILYDNSYTESINNNFVLIN